MAAPLLTERPDRRVKCRFASFAEFALAQCHGMMTFTELASVPSDPLAPSGQRHPTTPSGPRTGADVRALLFMGD